MFKRFIYIPDYQYKSGWDKYAIDYQNLLVKDTIYYLTKEIIHQVIDLELENTNASDFTILDVNCGTGNDFPFFFERGWSVVGCDGSAGMLNKAFETYEPFINSNRLTLFQGLIESIDANDFKPKQFDLIFSVTGGFSYVNDDQLKHINRILSSLLKPGGKVVLAHLNRFCLPEFLYRIYTFTNPFLRHSNTIKVSIKDEEHTMYLRSAGKLNKLYTSSFNDIRIRPLLSITPPYQTGFHPGVKTLNALRKLEQKCMQMPLFNQIADQVVVLGKKQNRA